MFSRVVHGIAVLLALLPAVLVDRAFGQSQAGQARNEVATFESRFSAITDLPHRPAQPAVARPTRPEHSMRHAGSRTAVRPQRRAGDRRRVLSKWNGVVADIRAESEILTRCRSDAHYCPAAARKFLAVIADGRAHDGRARIGIINRAINLAIQPMSDLAQWGVHRSLERAARHADDRPRRLRGLCDRQVCGVAGSGRRREPMSGCVIVRDFANGDDHAVVAARVDEKWIMLDNRRLTLIEDIAMPHVLPLFAFDQDGVKRFAPQMAEARRAPAPAESGTTRAFRTVVPQLRLRSFPRSGNRRFAGQLRQDSFAKATLGPRLPTSRSALRRDQDRAEARKASVGGSRGRADEASTLELRAARASADRPATAGAAPPRARSEASRSCAVPPAADARAPHRRSKHRRRRR